MRYPRLACLALAAALAAPALAAAQQAKLDITGIRVGYTGSVRRVAGNRVGAPTRFRVGQWAPVYVDLQVGNERIDANSYELVVETTDADDMQNVYVEKRFLPTLEPKEQPTVLAYVRTGSSGSEINVTVRHALTKVPLRSKKLTSADLNPLSANTYSYLSIGGPVPTLYKALLKAPNPAGGVGGAAPEPGMEVEPEESGNHSFAHLDMVAQMPTYWFGYQPADAVVLLTSTQQLVTDLNSTKQDDPYFARREALGEWVRRGGRLIISVSKNHQEVNQILDKMKLIDVTVEGQVQEPGGLPGVVFWAGATDRFVGLPPKDRPRETTPIDVAHLKVGRGVEVLAVDHGAVGDKTAHPVIVQAPCGLGRVTVVAFDLDTPPFATWKGAPQFWKKVQAETEPPNVTDNVNDVNKFNGFGGFNNQNGELAGKLVRSLEAFPDVPVISFGWVALFILVYIIIVGPLDYFFLKKVVKRLELTWITFPAVVLVISAVAYFAAYYLKGNDLRINKVDVVDVDLTGGHVYGNTWFTLFSPRIQNYTVGVEPGTGWGPEEKDPKKYAPFVGWMGRPEDVYGGGGRGGSQGLFRRAYEYAPESTGLVGVPIQVWSTKTFQGSWFRPIKEDELIEASLKVAKDDPTRMRLSGTIRSHLPVELRDVALFYRHKVYNLDPLLPEDPAPQQVDLKMAPGQGNELQVWFGQNLAQPNFQAGKRGANFGQEPAQQVGSYIKSVLFHGTGQDNMFAQDRNSSLRYLDEKWRLEPGHAAEAVLFARAALPAGKGGEGDAEDVSQGGLSASKLWLGGLPGADKRDKLKGTMSQETYIRVYIPVK